MTGDLDKQRQNILIVDDTPEIQQFLMKVFSDLEYIVTPVSSGNMAFKAIETDPPDLILLDINMPEMDGYEVCRRLKTSEAFREIPVIFLSAMHETIDKVKAFEAGGVDYITKPFQIKEVLARVKTHLDIRNLQKQLGKQNLQLQQQIIVCKKIEEELTKHKTCLEGLVAERTIDLQKINKELRKEIAERKQAEEVLKWKTALLEAQMNTSIDGILVIDENRKRIISNQRIIDLWDVPQPILDDEDDAVLLQYVVGLVKYPQQFLEKVMYLYDHPYETNRDEIEFKSGMVLDRYSAPVLDKDGQHYGRIWTFHDITERKHFEEALQKSEANLSAIMESTRDMIWSADADHQFRLLTFNTAFHNYFAADVGIDIHAGMALDDFLPPEVSNTWKGLYTRCLTEGRFQIEYKTHKGSITLLLNFNPVFRDGSIIAISVFGKDITERKQAEEALKESERMLRNEQKFSQLLLNTSPAFIVAIDFDGKTLMMNQSLLDVLEYSKEEITGTDYLATFVPEEDRQTLAGVFRQIIMEGVIAVKENRIRSRSGMVYLVEWRSQTVSHEAGLDFFVGVGIDITQRKIAEKLLEEQLQRFLVVTDQAPFGIALINREGTYTYINTKFKEMFGYDLADVPDGRTWFRKAYPDSGHRHEVIKTWFRDVERIEENISLVLEEKWIFTVMCKNNMEKIISFILLRLPTGEYLMTYEDITERKKTEEVLKKRDVELEIKSMNLEEMNAALKVLLKERESDKIELEEKILSNVKELVLPYIEKLKKSRLDSQHMTYVDIVETNLNDIVSPFLQKMGLKYANLTPTEIEIANLIKNGKSTKEIGDLLHMTPGAINFHRNNIRKKLGLNNEKVNLRSYLMSLQ